MAGAGSAARIPSHVDLVAKMMEIADVAGAVSNTDGMLGSSPIQRGGGPDFAKFLPAGNLFKTGGEIGGLHGAAGS